MKSLRILLLLLAGQMIIASSLFAQSAQIVDLKGRVLIKNEANSPWKRARLNMFLYENAQIKTQRRSECTVALDQDLENLVTIKENSHIHIENIIPSEIFLPRGRVFSLIDNIAKIQDFKIKTPTAIAGVRGTGLSTGFTQGCALILCFEDFLKLQGIAKQGNKTGAKNLPAGFGIKVCAGGELGDFFIIHPDDLKEWEDFKDNIDNLRDDEDGERGDDPLEDLKDEHRQDRHDDVSEDNRQEDDTRSGGKKEN